MNKWIQVNRVSIDREYDEVWHLVTKYADHDLIHIKKWRKGVIRVSKSNLEKTCIQRIKIVKGSFQRDSKTWIPHRRQYIEGPFHSKKKVKTTTTPMPKNYWGA